MNPVRSTNFVASWIYPLLASWISKVNVSSQILKFRYPVGSLKFVEPRLVLILHDLLELLLSGGNAVEEGEEFLRLGDQRLTDSLIVLTDVLFIGQVLGTQLKIEWNTLGQGTQISYSILL